MGSGRLSSATDNRESVQIGQLAVKSRLLTMFANREFVEAGGLMSYEPIVPTCLAARQPTWTRSSTRDTSTSL